MDAIADCNELINCNNQLNSTAPIVRIAQTLNGKIEKMFRLNLVVSIYSEKPDDRVMQVKSLLGD